MFSSPNNFQSLDNTPLDQQEALRDAFEMLHEAFPLVEKKLKDGYLAPILRELMRMAYDFFLAGDDRNGCYALQEVEGSVWPSRKVPPRHAPAAERRAHGKLERYAGVTPNLYPIQGKIEDMGQFQRQLYEAVLKAYADGTDMLAPLEQHYWLLGTDAVAKRFSARSRKAAASRFTQALSTSAALAALHATNVYGSLLVFDIEEAGRPRISVRGTPEVVENGEPNFFINEAVWKPDS